MTPDVFSDLYKYRIVKKILICNVVFILYYWIKFNIFNKFIENLNNF